MVKDTPSPFKIAAMVAFTLSCFAILLFLWISFGGSVPLRPEGYRLTASFPEAATLVEEADVRLAGVNVGKVRTRELDEEGVRTIAEIEIDSQYAPVPRDTKAILRQKTLLGETYVELTPGDPDAGMLEDGSRLADQNVREAVELDEIYRIFDEPTRDAFRGWIRSGSDAVGGNFARDFNDALGNLAPFATDGATLLKILDDQESAVQGVVRDTGRVFNALAAEEGQLRGLIENGEVAFGALASRDEALAETFQVFPTFLRETRTTLARLQTFAQDTRPLVNELRGPAADLAPTLRDLATLSPDLERLFGDLDPLIDASKRGLPEGARLLAGAEPVFGALAQLLPEVNPILAYLSFSRGQVAQFITVGGAALAGNGTGGYTRPRGAEHWLPQIALIDGESFMRFPTRPEFDRGNAYVAPNAYQRSIPLGVIESFSCPAGEERDPTDTPLPPPLDSLGIGARPPCFEQPASLFQNQKFPRLLRDKAPLVAAPRGIEGTEPAAP